MPQSIIPADRGWFAVYDEGGVASSYPVVAWVWDHDERNGHAVIVTEDDLISTEDLTGSFLGYRHETQMPNTGSVPNSAGLTRGRNRD